MAHVRVSRAVLAFAFIAVLALSASLLTTARSSAHASTLEVVSLTPGTAVHLATPVFLQVGKRYAFTWPGGGPPQTFAVKQIRPDGWILVDVADDITRPELFIPGEFPTRWLHVGLAISIQEMRPLP
jgi:predicted cation transporter